MAADDGHDRCDKARSLGEALAAFYRGADGAMRGLPVHNPALAVAAIGFRPIGDCAFGVIVTPWFMNLVRVPFAAERDALDHGATISRGLPVGVFDFTVARLDGIGTIESCSLFSAMFDFADQATAEAAATAALAAVFDPQPDAAPRPAPHTPVAVDRRSLLRGRFSERRP